MLSFFRKADFRNFWFEAGTPTFLLKLLKEDWLYQLNDLAVSEETFSSYDIEYLQVIPILFQTGYLTIKARRDRGIYLLDYPNAEVKESLLSYIVAGLRNDQAALTKPMVIQLAEAFNANDVERVITLIKSICRRIFFWPRPKRTITASSILFSSTSASTLRAKSTPTTVA